jgi:methylphosphotriester-DNA--protein-cysteine methyltransferase
MLSRRPHWSSLRKPLAKGERGTLGGHRGTRIYGRLDCPAAPRAIARGGYVAYRVFFLDERHARAAGYRPCGVCLPEKYRAWKSRKKRSAAGARRK